MHKEISEVFDLSVRTDWSYIHCFTGNMLFLIHRMKVGYQYRPSFILPYNCQIACQRWLMNCLKISKNSEGGLCMMRRCEVLVWRWAFIRSQTRMKSRLRTFRGSMSYVCRNDSNTLYVFTEMFKALPATAKRSADMLDAVTIRSRRRTFC